MSFERTNVLKAIVLCTAVATLVVARGKKEDPIAKAEKKDAEKPGVVAIKDTVKEAYIYGFPMLMDYAVMREYFVDRNSGQYKAPFNTIYNEARVFTPKDTAIVTPNSDTPYSFVGLDLRAEPIVLCVPAVEKSRYYLAGIYGNSAEEAVCPLAKTDSKGEPLDGSKHDYTITFAKDEYPPVNAFWSVTMYDGKTQLLVENPINRYLINSPMLPQLKKNPDGSLTLYIQKDSPAKPQESNWLPAPNGPIYMVMRLYWPKKEAPSVLPPGEGTWKPPVIVAAK